MKILLVENHPIVLNFYETTLQEYFSANHSLDLVKASDCKQAFRGIADCDNNQPFVLAILDYKLPPYLDEDIHSGYDLFKLVKKNCPNCKILIITGESQVLTVYDLLKKIRPDGFAIKSDIDTQNFIPIVTDVLNGVQFQSRTVKSCTIKIWEYKVMADPHNREIILNLAQGQKSKNLHLRIKLSQSTIQKRIVQIRKALNVPKDSDIISALHGRGFL